MSERERWIVYPLLFLAMGAALRDKLFDRTTSKSIVCQELIVVEDDPAGHRPARVLARIGSTDRSEQRSARGGQMFLDGPLLARTISADNYAYRGVQLTPSLRAILPGISPTDLLRALQMSAEALGGGTTQEMPEQPRAEDQPEQVVPPSEEQGGTQQPAPQ